jgi:hypothetical protein
MQTGQSIVQSRKDALDRALRLAETRGATTYKLPDHAADIVAAAKIFEDFICKGEPKSDDA